MIAQGLSALHARRAHLPSSGHHACLLHTAALPASRSQSRHNSAERLVQRAAQVDSEVRQRLETTGDVVTDQAVPEGHKGLHGFLYGEGGAEAHDSQSRYDFREVPVEPLVCYLVHPYAGLAVQESQLLCRVKMMGPPVCLWMSTCRREMAKNLLECMLCTMRTMLCSISATLVTWFWLSR